MNDKEYTYDIDKYTIGVDTNGEDGIGMTVAKVENGEIYFLGNCYGENARCIDLLIKENQKLKEQNKKEFADYIKFKKEQYDEYLKKINKLIKEKQELKKQLENNSKINVADHKYASTCEDKVIILETQQKQFIKYLEDKIKYFKDLEQFAIKIFNNKAVINLDLVKRSIEEDNLLICNFEEILQKYKSIIGVSDENNIKQKI